MARLQLRPSRENGTKRREMDMNERDLALLVLGILDNGLIETVVRIADEDAEQHDEEGECENDVCLSTMLNNVAALLADRIQG